MKKVRHQSILVHILLEFSLLKPRVFKNYCGSVDYNCNFVFNEIKIGNFTKSQRGTEIHPNGKL